MNSFKGLERFRWIKDVQSFSTDFYGEYCRNVPVFDGNTSYVLLDNPLVITGDFEANVEYVTPSISNHWANVLSFDNARLVTRGSNQDALEFRYLDPTERTMEASMNTDAGATTEMIIKRTGLVYTLKSIGSVSDEVTFTAPSLITHELTRVGYDISGIGEKDVFDGALYGVHVWTGGDRDTGTLVINLPMNEGINSTTGNIDFINTTGDTDYNATGYNLTVTEVCDSDGDT